MATETKPAKSEQTREKGTREEEYLYSHGWTKTQDAERCWQDNPPTAESQVKIGEERLPNGGKRAIMQTVVPAGAWLYTLADALALQRERDKG